MTTPSQPSKKSAAPSYRRQWLLTALLLTGLAIWTRHQAQQTPSPPTPLPSKASHPYSTWFQLVQLPELPANTEFAEAFPAHMLDWLKALRREGFVVLTLSQVLSQCERQDLLPERAVVLLFEPGYRLTYEVLEPVLAALKIPATWVTEDPGRHVTDRRFVSAKTRERMQHTGRWTVALRATDSEAFTLQRDGHASDQSVTFRWAQDAGRTGINWDYRFDALNRLNANRSWTTDEFIDRLNAELPIRSPTPLTARMIQDRLWGTLPRRTVNTPATFDLISSRNQYTAGTTWLGTAGVADAEVQLVVRERFGQLWVRLRADTLHARRISVGFTDDQLRVDVQEGAQPVRLATVPFTLAPGAELAATIRLEGSRLRVSHNHEVLIDVENIAVSTTPLAHLELTVADILPGAARALGVQMHYTPLAMNTAPHPAGGPP